MKSSVATQTNETTLALSKELEQCKALLQLQNVELTQERQLKSALVEELSRETNARKWVEDLAVVEAGLKATAELLEARTHQLIQLEKNTKANQCVLETERKALNVYKSDLSQQAESLKRLENHLLLQSQTAELRENQAKRRNVDSFCRDIVENCAIDALFRIKLGEIGVVEDKKRQSEELIEGLKQEISLCVGIKERLKLATSLISTQSEALKHTNSSYLCTERPNNPKSPKKRSHPYRKSLHL